MTSLVRASLLLFFLSGATGLVYEVLWTRRLTLTFGHTVLAVSTVLTAYMAGLALGSLLGGRWADARATRGGWPPERFLAVYGFLELFVGAWALVSLPLLGQVENAYLALSREGLSGAPLHLACFGGAVLVLIPPTVAMGATLPIMSRLLVRATEDLGRLLSQIYGINTLGAVAGAALGGFVLLPAAGLKASLLAAACVNLAIGTTAVLMLRGLAVPGEAPIASASPAERGWRILPVAFGLSGVASMAWQIGWTRALSLSLGSSVYAFSSILVVFLGGLALGSILYPILFRRATPTVRQLASLLLAIGGTGAVTIAALGVLPDVYFYIFPWVKDSFARVLAADFALAALILFAPTFLMGLTFPLTSQLYTNDLRLLGRSVGEVYSANTLGCIVGSFLAGFVMVPLLGAQATLAVAAAINATAGLMLVFGTQQRRRWIAALAGAVILAVVVLIPRWDTGRMGGGVAVNAGGYAGMSREKVERLLFREPAWYRDGISCTVSISIYNAGFEDFLELRVNGKVDASLGIQDRQTQYLLGYLPGLLHPDPRNAVVIGMGSGITLAALSDIPGLERIDCAEMEPAVLEAGRYWRDHNRRVLEDPRVHMAVTDGRTFVLGAPRKYDLIVSEPSNPWIAGIGNLFTSDFYEAGRQQLRPQGLMCQWLQIYSMTHEDIAMVLRSFYAVFPHGMVWRTSYSDLLLIGSAEPVRIDLERVRRVCRTSERVQRGFFSIGLYEPEQLVGHFVTTREHALQAVVASPLNTDDRPLLEFRAPFSLYNPNAVADNAALVKVLQSDPLPPGIPATPEMLVAAGNAWLNLSQRDAVDRLLSQWRGNHRPRGARMLLARFASVVLGKQEAIDKAFSQAIGEGGGLAWYLWGAETLKAGEPRQAVERLQRAAASPPAGGEESVLLDLGRALIYERRFEEARAALEKGAALPCSSATLTALGRALQGLNRTADAIRVLQEAADRNPADVQARLALGESLMDAGQVEAATRAFDAALMLMPDNVDALVAKSVSLSAAGDRRGAIAACRSALSLRPGHEPARLQLQRLEGVAQ